MNKIYFTGKHKIMEIISYVLLAVSFLIIGIAQKFLPAKVPTHYDLAGRVDGYGSPMTLFMLPAIMVFSNLVISFVIHFVSADFWSMPFRVKEEKKVIVYRDMVSLMLWIALEISIITLILTVRSCIQKMGGEVILTVLFLLAMMITIIRFCILAAKHNQ